MSKDLVRKEITNSYNLWSYNKHKLVETRWRKRRYKGNCFKQQSLSNVYKETYHITYIWREKRRRRRRKGRTRYHYHKDKYLVLKGMIQVYSRLFTQAITKFYFINSRHDRNWNSVSVFPIMDYQRKLNSWTRD